MTKWKAMEAAPKDGTLIDLNFAGIRYIDCHFERGRWCREHGYPSSLQVFLTQPTGWLSRPSGLVQPYEETDTCKKYVPA